LKNGWKHGIAGVEDGELNPESSFYGDRVKQKMATQRSKGEIDRRRLKRNELFTYIIDMLKGTQGSD